MTCVNYFKIIGLYTENSYGKMDKKLMTKMWKFIINKLFDQKIKANKRDQEVVEVNQKRRM